MSNYTIGFDDKDNLFVISHNDDLYYSSAWGSVILQPTYESFTPDTALSHSVVEKANQKQFPYSNLLTDQKIQIQIETPLGNLKLPQMDKANFKSLYTADKELPSDSARIEGLERRIKFLKEKCHHI